MSIEIENKLDRIIQLLEELLPEVRKPSIPTQGEDTEWHNPENVPQEQLGQGYRFLVPWEIGTIDPESVWKWVCGGWLTTSVTLNQHTTYRVPASTPIPPKP